MNAGRKENKGREIVEKVLATLKEWFGNEANEKSLLECYKDSGDAVPPVSLIWNDESVEYSIIDKFHLIFDPVARQIQEDFPDIKRISVYVEPSYDDYSRVVMVTENEVLYQDCIKAWHLVFSSIFEMKTYLEELYKKILDKINNQSRKEKSKKGR